MSKTFRYMQMQILFVIIGIGSIFHELTNFSRSWEGTEDVEVEEIVEKEGNAKGEGFMSCLAFITVKAKVSGEAKSYDWVVKSTPREANRFLLLVVLVDVNLHIRANLSKNMASDEREVAFYATLMPMLKKVGFVLSS